MWIVCALSTFLIYITEKNYKTTLHYIYMILRLFFTIVILFFALFLMCTELIPILNANQND